MSVPRDWRGMKQMMERLLRERTGEDLQAWNAKIGYEQFESEHQLRAWLAQRGVTGYPQTLLVMERFGYPDYLLASADELIGAQYADRAQLRPVLDAILHAAMGLGQVEIQARKTYVSLLSPRRTFARVQPSTRNRVDLALRLDGMQPGGRLLPSKIHESMPVQISLTSPDQVDDEVLELLQRTYQLNC